VRYTQPSTFGKTVPWERKGSDGLYQELLDKIKAAGVVGAGGGGFPTYKKLTAEAKTVIINGAECEPLLRVDQQLLEFYTKKVIDGLQYAMGITGAESGVIALKKKHIKASAALLKAIESHKELGLHFLRDIYPAGDEHLLIYDVTGKAIPPGKLPLVAGSVVLNVETALNICNAAVGIPVISKFVTVAGAVKRPGTFQVPLGMTAKELITMAGGSSCLDYLVINGGPCMGSPVTEDSVVTKTTKGFIILPVDHPHAAVFKRDIAVSLKRAKAVCSQCMHCTELCPRHLLGHPIEPHRVMRAVAYNLDDPGLLGNAMLCSECGVCDLFSCTFGLSPRMMNKAVKARSREQGIAIPQPKDGTDVLQAREWQQIPTQRLIKRLALSEYDKPAPLVIEQIEAYKVRLPLKQHAGAPAVSVVETGDKVKKGQLIAVMKSGALGADLHASIDGTIAVTNSEICITAEGGGER
jgi:Predicted NADH:ubiquinone oxidoreductase, subunit RnfC